MPKHLQFFASHIGAFLKSFLTFAKLQVHFLKQFGQTAEHRGFKTVFLKNP